jgi:hypothetical protein
MFKVFLISSLFLFTPHGATIKDNLKLLESFSSSFRPTMRADLKANVALPDDIASSTIGTYVRGELSIVDDDTFYEEISTDEAVKLLRSIINGNPYKSEGSEHDQENDEGQADSDSNEASSDELETLEEDDYNNQDQTDGSSQSEESNISISSQEEEAEFDLTLLQVESVEYYAEVTSSAEEGDASISQNQHSTSGDVITQGKEYISTKLSESFNQAQDLTGSTSIPSSDNSNTVQSSNTSSNSDSKKESLWKSDLGKDELSKKFLQD